MPPLLVLPFPGWSHARPPWHPRRLPSRHLPPSSVKVKIPDFWYWIRALLRTEPPPQGGEQGWELGSHFPGHPAWTLTALLPHGNMSFPLPPPMTQSSSGYSSGQLCSPTHTGEHHSPFGRTGSSHRSNQQGRRQ